MNKWDELRNIVNKFDLQEEIMRVDLSKKIDIKASIKEFKKFNNLASFGSLGVFNPSRAIFTPRENARQKGHLFGLSGAFTLANKILNDAITYDWDTEAIRNQLAKLIKETFEALKTVQETYNEKNIIKIEQEMHVVSQLHYLIHIWQQLFYNQEQFKEFLSRQ